MPEQARSELRRERILSSALTVFTAKGYRAAAMDDIASAAETSKGGLYFHFPNKQTLYLALLDRMARLLMSRAEEAIGAAPDPLSRIDAALKVVLETFAGHRSLARLFLIDALGAGPEFNARLMAMHRDFAGLIARHLDEAVAEGAIAPLDSHVAGMVWFGAINEVVTNWLTETDSGQLLDQYPELRRLLRRSAGIPVEVSGIIDDHQ